jgi:predicted transcriptional regulator
MTEPVSGVLTGVDAGHGARDRSANRGPSPVHPAHAGPARERMPTMVFAEHEDLARVVAGRIASLIRARAAEGRPARRRSASTAS